MGSAPWTQAVVQTLSCHKGKKMVKNSEAEKKKIGAL